MLMDVLCSGQPAIIGSAGFAAAWGVWWRGALKARWSVTLKIERYMLLFQCVEFKRADVPRLTSSMRIALGDLQLDHLYVVYPGAQRFALAERVEAVPLEALLASPR
jgi:hypothetical protein